LDLAKGDLDRLRTRTSSDDFVKIDAHLEGLRAIERRLDSMTPAAACTAPTAPAAAKGTNTTYPSEIASMFDLVTHAFACDLTRVASVQLSHGFSGIVHTWLGQTIGHHTMSHDTAVDRRPELQAIDAWYATQIAALLTALDSVNEGTGTMLDNTLVVWGRELGTTSHRMQPHPVVLAGGGNLGLRTGRFLDVSNEPHAKLLVSIAQLMGLPTTSVGNIQPNSGPLTKLA
jgi:hypothetical protein